MPHSSADAPFGAVHGHRYMPLTTYRRNGTAVSTAVWFAEADDGTLWVMTPHDTGKVKRVRRNAVAQVAPSSPRGIALGSAVAAVIDIVDDEQLARHAHSSLRKKYGWMKFGLDLLLWLRRAHWIYLRVRPAHQ